jgi:hypothetical protein
MQLSNLFLQSLHKSGRKKLPLRQQRILLAVNLLNRTTIRSFLTHIPLHIGDVVEFGDVAVFLHVWAFVFGHGGEEVFDDFVWDERVAEVEFCYVGLGVR